MKPNTNHWVISLKDTLVLEGHFYCHEHLKETMRGLILDHFIGDTNTNTEHLNIPSLLMRELCAIADNISIGKEPGDVPTINPDIIFSLNPHLGDDEEYELEMDLQNLAYLLITVHHLNRLAPTLVEDDVMEYKRPWQESKAFKDDRRKTEPVIEFMRRWFIRDEEDQIEMLRIVEDDFTTEGTRIQTKLKITNEKRLKADCLCTRHRR